MYNLLLHLYPASFRNEYGTEMRPVFERGRAEASGLAVVMAANRFAVVGVENGTHVAIRMQHKWGDGQWATDVLQPGGKMAYFGPPADGLKYFTKSDWADVFQAFDDPSIDWAGRYLQSPAHQKYVQADLIQPLRDGPHGV